MIAFTVNGKPEPGGSKTAYPVAGRCVVVDANKNVKAWREKVAEEARKAMRDLPPYGGPLEARFDFAMPRGKTVKRVDHTVRPDTTKLVRAVEDALTGIVYDDDAQIVKQSATKAYTDKEPHVKIVIRYV